MSAFLRKYAVATASGTHVGIPMIKAGFADFATGSDWTPATGDVKVSIDGATQANIATLPSYTNGQWAFQLSASELTGKSIRVAVVDSATKVVEDQFFVVETYGNASALHPFDLGTAASAVPTANENADALLDRADGVESGFTFRQVMRLIAAVLLGKASNSGSTFRDLGDTKDRVTATADDDGNRTAVTRDAS